MPPIIYEKKGNIAFITINRPERRNALNFEAFGLLAKAWLDFRDDPDLWVAIITGAGDKAFCAGGDLKEFIHMVTQNIGELSASGGTQTFGGDVPVNASLVAVLREVEIFKPIIAAVNGFCIAGGMEMLQGTDIRIASENAIVRHRRAAPRAVSRRRLDHQAAAPDRLRARHGDSAHRRADQRPQGVRIRHRQRGGAARRS